MDISAEPSEAESEDPHDYWFWLRTDIDVLASMSVVAVTRQ